MFSKSSYTLNFDGSHNNQANTASAGCIIRDNKGDLVVAAAYNLSKTNLPCYNVAIAEATGLRNGLQLAQKHYLKPNIIKGDNKEVIDLVLGQARRLPGPPLSGIIAEIKVLIGHGFVEVLLINGDDNKVADNLATMGSSLLPTEFKVFTRFDSFQLPSRVAELIRQEKVSSIRKESDDDGEGSSLASNIGMAGAAVAGVAMLAWGVSKLFSGESSSSSSLPQQNFTNKALEVQKSWDFLTNNASDSPKKNPDFYTLQYFGSDRNQLQKARAGCIIRNNGEFYVAAAYNLDHQYPDCNIAIAEAIALMNGLNLASDYHITLGLIQGRNVEVRDRVLDREKRPPRSLDLIGFIQEIKYALYEHGIVDMEDTMRLVEEDRIKVARALATVGGTLNQEAVIYKSFDDLPPRVASLV